MTRSKTSKTSACAWRLAWLAPLLLLAGLVHAQQEHEAVLVAPQAETPADVQQILDYWSDEAMNEAKPLIVELPDTGSLSPREGERGADADATAQVEAPSGRPGGSPPQSWMDPDPATPAPLQQFGAFPFSYTRYRLFPDLNLVYTTFPYATIGKLFFNIPGQGNFVCSGSSVNSTNRSVVWTAGHCVYTPGIGWHRNFLFVPARRAFGNPFGAWTARQAWTLVGWTLGFFEYDMGALVMNRGGGGNLHIGNAVGWLGFLANASRLQHWHLHGYPAAPRNLVQTPLGAQFDGEHHELCAATWATNDMGGNGPATLGVGCDKTGGTSGGPWTVDFNGVPGLTNMLNSNNSYRYGGGPPNNLRLYGPYFTTGAINLRNAAQAVPVP